MWVLTLAVGMACILTFGAPAWAQINIDDLNPVNTYDAGVLQPGADRLGKNLWQGTTAARATEIINTTDTSANGTARHLIRIILLSGGAPPKSGDTAEREAYMQARLAAVLRLGHLDASDQLVSRLDLSKSDSVFSKIFAERALLGGDIQTACEISDTHILARKAPYWAKLRGFCHSVRGELPAAEITADLLSRLGHKDKIFYALLGELTGSRTNLKLTNVTTPLHIAMLGEVRKIGKQNLKNLPKIMSAQTAQDIKQPADIRLKALFASAQILSAEQIRSVLGGLASFPLENMENFEAIRGEKTWSGQRWGEVYLALAASHDTNLSAQLTQALLARADKNEALIPIAAALETHISNIPTSVLAQITVLAEITGDKNNVGILARLGVNKHDTGILRALFLALDEDAPFRARIALASDALGGGFYQGELGVDIETRLTKPSTRARAVRDSYIAQALGVNMSATAIDILSRTKLTGQDVNQNDMLALQALAQRGAKAELALRVAEIFGEVSPRQMRSDSFAAILSAMVNAGMTDMARQLAAKDLLNHD